MKNIPALLVIVIGALSGRLASAQDPPPIQAQPPSIEVAPKSEPAPAPTPPAPAASAGFGYDAFQSSAGPIVGGPIDDQYLLAPGDEVVVSIWGELNETMNLPVSEHGFLELPEGAGRIQTNGVTLKDLKPLMERALSNIYAAYINPKEPSKSTAFVDIRLGKIQPVLVYVVQEVNKPGAYPVSAAVANVINVLTNAGGVRPSGTLREIKIRRRNGSEDVVDLYDFVLNGKIDFEKTRLHPGDYVIVPLKQRSVTISGAVRRPMNYELVGTEGMRELLALAGGATPDGYLKQVQLKRTLPNVGETYIDIDLAAILAAPEGDLALLDKDVVTIPVSVQVRRPIVSIRGDGITRPGTYEWTKGMRLSDLIDKGEGLREHAYLERADLVRTGDDFTKKLEIFPLAGLYERNSNGGYVRAPNSDALDFPLREMDEVLVQSSWGLAGKDKKITLSGHVKEAGEMVLPIGMTLYDALFARGGFQDPDFAKGAYMDLAHVVRKVPGNIGTRLVAFNLKDVLARDASANMALDDGDLIRIFAYKDLAAEAKVAINGTVRNGGTFPYSEGITLEDLIVLGGGIAPQAVRPEAVIARKASGGTGDSAGRSATAIVVALDTESRAGHARTPLEVDDVVTIRHQAGWEPFSIARIEGEVLHPGSYPLPRTIVRLTDLIELGSGLKPEAFPEGASLRRRRPGTEASEPAGQFYVSIDLVAALATPGGPSDVVVLDGDQLIVPKSSGAIEIRGAVKQPMFVHFEAGRTLDDYLAMCGGLLVKADRGRVTIKSPSGSALLVGEDENPSPIPGSVIDIPLQRESERMRTVEVKGAVAKPAIVQFTDDATLGYYIGLCGGFTANADLEKIVIILPDGGILSSTKDVPFNPLITPGSLVVVTARPISEGK